MTVSKDALAADMVADIWENLEDRLSGFDLPPEVWMHILGVFQHSVEAFGLERGEAGIPTENADILFAKNVTKPSSNA